MESVWMDGRSRRKVLENKKRKGAERTGIRPDGRQISGTGKKMEVAADDTKRNSCGATFKTLVRDLSVVSVVPRFTLARF